MGLLRRLRYPYRGGDLVTLDIEFVEDSADSACLTGGREHQVDAPGGTPFPVSDLQRIGNARLLPLDLPLVVPVDPELGRFIPVVRVAVEKPPVMVFPCLDGLFSTKVLPLKPAQLGDIGRFQR